MDLDIEVSKIIGVRLRVDAGNSVFRSVSADPSEKSAHGSAMRRSVSLMIRLGSGADILA